MTRTAAGEIVLSREDERRVNVLLASLDQHVRQSLFYTSSDITKFVRDWRAAAEK